MRQQWSEQRVTCDGDHSRTVDAAIDDRPEGGVPIYVAAGGPQMAKYVGRVGDGSICTSGKGMELRIDQLLPATEEALEAGDHRPQDILRMIEIELSCAPSPGGGAREHAVLSAAVGVRGGEAPPRRPDGDGGRSRPSPDRAGRLALDLRDDARGACSTC